MRYTIKQAYELGLFSRDRVGSKIKTSGAGFSKNDVIGILGEFDTSYFWFFQNEENGSRPNFSGCNAPEKFGYRSSWEIALCDSGWIEFLEETGLDDDSKYLAYKYPRFSAFKDQESLKEFYSKNSDAKLYKIERILPKLEIEEI